MLTKQEREDFIERIKKEGPFIIFEAEDKYKDDEVLMKGLIKLNGAFIACASDRLKKKESIIETACLKPYSYLRTLNGVPYDFAIQFIDVEYLNSHPEVVISFLAEHMEHAQVLPKELLFKNKKIFKYVLENLDRSPILWFNLPEKIKYKKEDDEIYEMTNEGIEALNLTIDMIPGILKLEVDSKFKKNLDSVKDKFSVTSEYTPISEREFTVRCKIVENNSTLFDLHAHAGSREQAKKIVDNWNTNAAEIYPKILELLIN